jgi:hypothetical protein
MRPFSLPRRAEAFLSFALCLFCATAGFFPPVGTAAADEMPGVQALLVVHEGDLSKALPADSHLLLSPDAIEDFLVALDGAIPDWPAVYGTGHHDERLDDRLFQLNRDRDEQRKGKEALTKRLTFCWSGTLAPYEPARGGFPVAVGPDFTKTTWGLVRFKPEDLPANLTATGAPPLRDRLVERMKNGTPIEVTVAMTGRLIPEESVIYDFSHEEEGQGLIMPVVRVEQVNYVLVERPQ